MRYAAFAIASVLISTILLSGCLGGDSGSGLPTVTLGITQDGEILYNSWADDPVDTPTIVEVIYVSEEIKLNPWPEETEWGYNWHAVFYKDDGTGFYTQVWEDWMTYSTIGGNSNDYYFADADGDGFLSVGDYFSFRPYYPGSYRMTLNYWDHDNSEWVEVSTVGWTLAEPPNWPY